MQITAPCPEMGAPNLEKCGAWYTQCMCNFFPFLARALAVGSTVGMQNFGRGCYSLLEILGKTTLEQTTGTTRAASVRYSTVTELLVWYVSSAVSDLPPTVSWPMQQQQQLVVVGHSVSLSQALSVRYSAFDLTT